MKKTIVFDIDGTLADLSHRLHHVESRPKDWDAFFGAMEHDPPYAPLQWLHSLLHAAPDASVVIASGRPDNYRALTEEWFARHDIAYERLYMRKAGDRRPDSVVKREFLPLMRADGFDPYIVIEDRQRVVDMWRAEGICCLQCAPGNF